MKQILKLISILLIISSCFPEGFQEETNQKFGDQHFKTAIALIELHKIREGEYPEGLDNLKYTGDWDKIIFHSVQYTKLEQGYELNLINGWIGKPEKLSYPEDFWTGLGIVKSNIKK